VGLWRGVLPTRWDVESYPPNNIEAGDDDSSSSIVTTHNPRIPHTNPLTDKRPRIPRTQNHSHHPLETAIMADTLDKPKRKSVAFSDGTKVVDEDGQITEMNGGGEKSTAESHSSEGDAAVDEVTVSLQRPKPSLV
jgi:hypothetical protein